MITASELQRRIESALPGARVQVATFRGDDHFEVLVEAPQFRGKGRVEQHRMVYAVVGDLLDGAVHALALKTLVLESASPSA